MMLVYIIKEVNRETTVVQVTYPKTQLCLLLGGQVNGAVFPFVCHLKKVWFKVFGVIPAHDF